MHNSKHHDNPNARTNENDDSRIEKETQQSKDHQK